MLGWISGRLALLLDRYTAQSFCITSIMETVPSIFIINCRVNLSAFLHGTGKL